jgi:hypothetical protein
VEKTDTIWIDEFSQSPLVDGFIVNIENNESEFVLEQSGWVVGRSTYRWRVNLDKNFAGTLNLNINYPADFEFTFSDMIIDTAENKFGYPPRVATKFRIQNTTENTNAHFQFKEFYEVDSTLSPYYPWQNPDSIEAAMIWVNDPDPANRLHVRTSWRLYFEADTPGQDPPAPGDIFRIVTRKPFRTGDNVTFKVSGKKFNQEKARVDMEKIAVVPNPYVAAVSWEPRSPFRTGRGERRIYFTNLPPQCTIRIYTISGFLVDTIEHETSIEDGSEPWNLLSRDGQDIAYGVYIYHVESPGIGEKIGKFALIK